MPAIAPVSTIADAVTAEDEALEPMVEPIEDELVRGLEGELAADEFAMVFSVDGALYLQLASDDVASDRGTPRMSEQYGITSVVAPVATAAMPDALKSWAGRTVLVDGTCRARVVGFAEVSRVTGFASDPYNYDDDGNRIDPEPWTIERVTESNVTLAAKLDGCSGTWARAESVSPAAVAQTIEDAALESAAIGDLLAKHDDDANDASWKEQGGEGDWRDDVDVASTTWEHPFTNERWVFVQASMSGGGCGEPSMSLMAAYRAQADGTLHRFTDLSFAWDTIQQIVDVDGDGQPELLLGGGERALLVDLANKHHASIDVTSHGYEGCGC